MLRYTSYGQTNVLQKHGGLHMGPCSAQYCRSSHRWIPDQETETHLPPDTFEVFPPFSDNTQLKIVNKESRRVFCSACPAQTSDAQTLNRGRDVAETQSGD